MGPVRYLTCRLSPPPVQGKVRDARIAALLTHTRVTARCIVCTGGFTVRGRRVLSLHHVPDRLPIQATEGQLHH